MINTKKILAGISCLLLSTAIFGQQVPNPGFEDWSGATFDGEIQPASWHASNVTQLGFTFNFAHREGGHNSSYSMMVQDQDVGAAGITETSPGYVSLGQPWVYLPSITKISQATAGTAGGIDFSYRPDTMSVWIRRTGSNALREDFYLLYYAWTGQARGDKYKNKNGGCTDHTEYDEESDVRLALNANECGTAVKVSQISEGMWREKAVYNNWTNIRVPIYYLANTQPTRMNIIFSASNYPNFRANSGLYAGNSLYIDDVELIYSNKIQVLYINNVQWAGFDPNSSDVQVYSLGEGATTMPTIAAYRGMGTLTNARGESRKFSGRKLDNSEMTITEGTIDGAPTVITVRPGDGGPAMTYKIKFVRAASTNTKLAGIMLDSVLIPGFTPDNQTYDIALPYGTTVVPEIEPVKQEAMQTVSVTPASSVTGTATIVVTAAAGGSNQRTYTLRFSVAQLSDNTLKDILVCARENVGDTTFTSLRGFNPSVANYRVSVPEGTTLMPLVRAVSNYPAGAQTIVYNPATIHDNPVTVNNMAYTISVTTPGNPVAKTYKLTFKEEKSSYSKLQGLHMYDETGYDWILNYDPDNLIYYVNFPLGTRAVPEVTWEKGDKYQQEPVVQKTGGLENGGLDGTIAITVTAANGDQTVYKVFVTTEKSDRSDLAMIYLNGDSLDHYATAPFSSDVLVYDVPLPTGTSELPVITVEQGDPMALAKVAIKYGKLNGTTNISVTAQDGTVTIYQLNFSVQQSTDVSLKMIYLDGDSLKGYERDVLEYWVVLPKTQDTLPVITYDKSDASQIVSPRGSRTDANSDYQLVVRLQSGASRTYTLHFSTEKSSETRLQGIRIGGKEMVQFDENVYVYDTTLVGVSAIPAVKGITKERTQISWVEQSGSDRLIYVKAENGDTAVYTIHFHVEVSENAFLKMIYVNGDTLEGYVRTKQTYSYVFRGDTCPSIRVEREDAKQQVTITRPYDAGDATIKVQAENGAANVYTISFIQVADSSALLAGIELDGIAMSQFEATQFAYDTAWVGPLPTVTAIKKDAAQQVQTLSKGDTVMLYVRAGSKSATYVLKFMRAVSADCTLSNILVDGTPLSGFAANVLHYDLPLPAGSAMPEVTFVPQSAEQSLICGKSGTSRYEAQVTAANGTDKATYVVDVQIAPYSNVQLANIEMDDRVFAFQPAKFAYTETLGIGARLPILTVTTNVGQTAIVSQRNENEQIIIVKAESGDSACYVITYQRAVSSNVQLRDIEIDGVSLPGFDPNVYAYVDSLARGTEVVPVVHPIGQTNTQIITTYYSQINGVTKIEVRAADGISRGEYTIAFPVRYSSKKRLSDIYLDDPTIDFEFSPSQTDYTIMLPSGTTEVPAIHYDKEEAEQTIEFISRPLGQTTQLIVRAENGETTTYNLLFKEKPVTKPNRLTSIRIVEKNQSLDLSDTDQRKFVVDMPYGSRTLTVEYEKMFAQQTVMVQPGGVRDTTFITVKSNRDGEADEVYQIIPNLDTQNPAVLDSIKVNGQLIPGFDKNRFSYVVNVNAVPTLDAYKSAAVSMVTTPITNSNHWQFVAFSGAYKNTYDVWFHYPNEVVPNADFTEWTTAAHNSAPKPTGWKCIADYFTEYSATGTHTFGQNGEVEEVVVSGSNKAVQLNTKKSAGNIISALWGGALGGYLPAWIALDSISGSLQVAGGSTFTPEGNGISFHNSPDVMLVRAKTGSVVNNNRIVYHLSGSGSHKLVFSTDANTDYKEYQFSLADANKKVSAPANLNIILNSYYKESMSTTTDGGDADMAVDYIKFSYNNILSALQVNGVDASLSKDTFKVDLEDDPEYTMIPALAFTGQVSDQAQKVTWGNEKQGGAYGVRLANVVNYGEDGKSKNYVIQVRRKRDTRNTLSDIKIGGASLPLFTGTTNDYEYHMTLAQKQIPDVMCVPQSSLQKIQTSYADSTLTIVVTPEYGEARTYSVRFITDLSNNTKLSYISDVTGFDPEVREYTLDAERLPDLSFTKVSDGQTVDSRDGRLLVTAENGDTASYIVRLPATSLVTTGQLSALSLDGVSVSEFAPTKYDYTAPRPDHMSFVRQDLTDSVVYVQSPAGMQWQVYGSEQHTYEVTFASTLSSDTQLETILVNGDTLDGFVPSLHNYEVVRTSASTLLTALTKEDKQQVAITEKDGTYTIVVTAEDGTIGEPYVVALKDDLSPNADLAAILIDSVAIPGFRSDSTTYVVVLPTPDVKTAEPTMPTIQFVTADAGAKVDVLAGKMGTAKVAATPTEIYVTSADTLHSRSYSVTIQAEPSHNSALTGILVNDVPVERFETGRHYYSASTMTEEIEITWTSEDNFQSCHITTDTMFAPNGSISSIEYTLPIVAQDGINKQVYTVVVYVEGQSSDATLANILLDGMEFSDFHTERNRHMEFAPMNNVYRFNLPPETVIPEVSAKLMMPGQQVNILSSDTAIYLVVTAKDGVTKNTYSLYFDWPVSSYTGLAAIMVDGDTVKGFRSDLYFYTDTLPVGYRGMPIIEWEKSETKQHVDTAINGDDRVTFKVLAEDRIAYAEYHLILIRTRSAVNTLDSIEDGYDLSQVFSPDTFYYHRQLPVGTTDFPVLTPYPGDKYQIVSDTAFMVGEMKIYQISVLAENGTRNMYTITYEILKSTVDSLAMIYVGGVEDSLANYRGDVVEYEYLLPANATQLPYVGWDPGDEYQLPVEKDTVDDPIRDVKSFGKKIVLRVKAQNGLERTYTIRFPMKLSSEANLDMIFINGSPLRGFYEGHYEYGHSNTDTIKLINDSIVPAVTVATKEGENQTYSTQYVDTLNEDNGLMEKCFRIIVTAEDQVTTRTYLIFFSQQKQNDDYIKNPLVWMVYLDNDSLASFQPHYSRYDESLPLGTKSLPDVSWVTTADSVRMQVVGDPATDSLVTVTLVPYVRQTDGSYSEYTDHTTLCFHIARSSDARLTKIVINGLALDDFADKLDKDSLLFRLPEKFHPDSSEYMFQYALGVKSDKFFHYDGTNIQYTLSYPDAKVDSIVEDTTAMICIYLHAEDGSKNVYRIAQQITKSSENRLKMIYIASDTTRWEELYEFDPDEDRYTIKLAQGNHSIPMMKFVPMDSTATIPEPVPADLETGDPMIVTVIAEDGKQKTYYIYVVFSTIDDSASPVANDVLVKNIGNGQILVATIRYNVSFSLFDGQGRLLLIQLIKPCDPNDAQYVIQDGREKLYDVRGNSGEIISLHPHQVYIYGFYESESRRIVSGKLLVP